MQVIVKEFPLIDKVIARFPDFAPYRSRAIFAYGEDLYNPGGGEVTMDLLFHEAVHAARQKDKGTDEWWDEYLRDDAFRLAEEVLAYRTQYLYFCTVSKDRNQRARFLMRLAKDLSGPLYGSICSYNEAFRLIRNK